MCTVVFAQDGTEIGSVAELRLMWPTIIELNAGVLHPAADEDFCLCGVDVPGTARVNGARVRYDDGFDEYKVTK
ncbi:MAG: hypothetical protein H0U67_09385 [Gemmatimonadetes bacterium]|nr:hypothetical protein [Gemmatimonadota bacterium]